MNKRETHIVTGMTRDLSVSRFDNKFVVDARNIRITSTKDNATLLSVTNEKGTGRFTVNGSIKGVILGHAVLNKTLVLFTTEHTTTTSADPIPDNNGVDRIYKLDFSDDFNSATSTVLFEGNLNFYYKNPLETLPYYETDSIQKVYWVDGRNQPRVIDIKRGLQTNADVFNFNRKIGNNHTLSVEKFNTGGQFPAGTIQYCFNYFNKFGQETNIVDVSPLYYLCPQEKGLPADGMDTSSFVIKLTGANPEFEYVRLYAITRTSENATPYVRIVGDYKISNQPVVDREQRQSTIYVSASNLYWVNEDLSERVVFSEYYTEQMVDNTPTSVNIGSGFLYDNSTDKYYSLYYLSTEPPSKIDHIVMFKTGNSYGLCDDAMPFYSRAGLIEVTFDSTLGITITDNGIVGSTIDASTLLFIGGQDVIAGTFTSKNNTLFLGNIKQNVPNVGNIQVDNTTIKDAVKNTATPCAFDYDGQELSEFTIDDNDSAVSEEFYDYQVNNNRSSYQIKSFKARENYRLGLIAQYNTGQWSEVLWIGDVDETIAPGVNLFISENGQVTWGKSYHKPGFKAVLSSNIVNALKNAGFIRVAPVVIYPNDAERLVFCQGILTSTVYNVKDRSTNSPFAQSDWRFRMGYNWTNIENEIQTNFGPRHGRIPIVLDENEDIISNESFVDLFSTEFYRDSNILDFYSPDMESSNDSIGGYFKNLKLRIVGFSNAGFDSNKDALLPKSKLSYYIRTKNSGFYQYSSVLNGPTEADSNDSLLYPGYQDLPVEEDTSDGWVSLYGALREKSIEYPDHWNPIDRFIVAHRGDSVYEFNTDSSLVKWYTYLWHRSGSLNNQGKLSTKAASLNTERTAELDRKCTAEFKYGRTTFLQGNILNAVGPTSIDVDKLDSMTWLDSENMSLQRLGDSSEIYYGNIDKVIIPTFKDIPEDYIDVEGNPVDWSYGSYGYPIGFDSYETLYGGTQSPANMPKYATEIFLYDNVQHLPSPTEGEMTEGFFGSDPVVMRYVSTKHAIVKLISDESLYTFGNFGNSSIYTNAQLFWNDNSTTIRQVPVFRAVPDFGSYHGLDEGLYIGELYRNFTEEQMLGRFGGVSDSAITNGVWNRCGESIKLDGQVTLYYREGDTYIGRYDFLKSHPVSEEDINQVISIYSTEIESRVNLDARYDKFRGSLDNTFVRPTNFNLFNRPGYEQSNQFFTFKAIDYDRYKSLNHPNLVSFTTEKKPGADIDAWTSVPMTSTFDLKGELGEITKLTTLNNTLLSFQNRGVAQILFNERVQIPASDGQPIEITNGLKYGGYRYLSDQIGMTNKWSLQTTPNGVYFIDDEKNTLYQFNGQQFQDLSGKAGFRTWLSEHNSYDVWNPVDFGNIVTWYDRVNSDLYFMNKNESLVYSEQIGNFISFMDYAGLPMMVNMNDRFLTSTLNLDNRTDTLWELWAGNYNMFFDSFKPYWLTFISNTDPTVDKVFDNLAWRTMDYSVCPVSGKPKELNPLTTFDTMRVWHEHQDTQAVELINIGGKPSILKKKFNVFRAVIPRDRLGLHAKSGRDRIRNTWSYIQLSRCHPNTDLMVFTDLDVDFFE